MTSGAESPNPAAALRDAIEALLTASGWQSAHFAAHRRRAAGWPDLLAIRPPWFAVIAIKGGQGRGLTIEQQRWLSRFAALSCARAWVLWPGDEVTAKRWIEQPGDAPRAFGFQEIPLDFLAPPGAETV